jgi:hypothetical protein
LAIAASAAPVVRRVLRRHASIYAPRPGFPRTRRLNAASLRSGARAACHFFYGTVVPFGCLAF